MLAQLSRTYNRRYWTWDRACLVGIALTDGRIYHRAFWLPSYASVLRP